MLPLLKTSAHQWRRPSKQSDQPGAKYSREQEDGPASTCRSPVTTSRLQQQHATSGAYMRVSRKLLDQPREKKASLKTSSGEVITDKVEQMERWVEHYLELYSREKVVFTSAMDASAHHGGVRSYTKTARNQQGY